MLWSAVLLQGGYEEAERMLEKLNRPPPASPNTFGIWGRWRVAPKGVAYLRRKNSGESNIIMIIRPTMRKQHPPGGLAVY